MTILYGFRHLECFMLQRLDVDLAALQQEAERLAAEGKADDIVTSTLSMLRDRLAAAQAKIQQQKDAIKVRYIY